MKIFNKTNWERRTVFWGLGWGYFCMILSEIINYACLDPWFGIKLSWQWEAIVVKLVVWTLCGLTFGRWVVIQNQRAQQSKSKRNDKI
ncbi:hypothetical protein [uncultured Rikenella sp.]|uniref:hypothetical protein n=1 Tax=uncultured Rikenella sp. TaxID=368003 RepID=UPI002626C5EB|nr:hypothetical protein [uncultured Rikenella sp.]